VACKVLIDIRVAGATEHAGIPQDCRLMVKTLGRTENVELAVLIHPDFKTDKFVDHVDKSPTLAAALLLNGYGSKYGKADPKYNRSLKRLVHLLRNEVRKRVPYKIAPVHRAVWDALWRTYLRPTLSHQDRSVLAEVGIFISAIPENEMNRWRRRPRTLNTRGFDFVIFPDLRFLRVPAGTTKILRFHDALPITASDMFLEQTSTEQQFRVLARGCKDSFLVCNSEPTRNQLLSLFPELESRSTVIPCTLPDLAVWQSGEIPLSRIVASRSARKGRAIFSVTPPAVVDTQEFVLMVSTLEPRKNHLGAINAFQRVQRQLGRDIKLVIVGTPGWKCEPILRAIAEGGRAHSVIHLTDVPQDELACLYRKARAVLFPSFAEGFGFAPLEAMQCGTPTVVSDIPAHRWVLQDAALFADPYDPAAIAKQLSLLLSDPNERGLRPELQSKAAKVLDRYSVESTSQQWATLFERLKSRND
jgi:glycosyltransferase involved in cell wall biosynthesis